GETERETFETSNNIVLVGANGSGKSRLGVWIEQQLQNETTVHRISAQKALNIPDYAQIKNLEQAQNDLLLGRSDKYADISRKIQNRWNDNPVTHLLNDYDKLLSLLFAKSAERNRKHTSQTKEEQKYIEVPDSPIDKIIDVWKEIMPQREIAFTDGKVLVNKQGEKDYHGKEMSDGERVALYLIGQCLCTPG